MVPVWWKEGDQNRLLLHYQPSAPPQGREAGSDAAPAKHVTWNREQIEDFTRKLGFLEKGLEDGMHFTFQRLSAVRLHTVMTALSALLNETLRACVLLTSFLVCADCSASFCGAVRVSEFGLPPSDREGDEVLTIGEG